jgi:hypothetical protein
VPTAPPASSGEACTGPQAPAKKLMGWPVRKVEDFAKDKVKSGAFDTDGIVSEVFEPESCPPQAMCKPQPPRHLMVTPVGKPTATLLVIVSDTAPFKVKKHYALSLVVCGGIDYGATLNVTELRAFEAR